MFLSFLIDCMNPGNDRINSILNSNGFIDFNMQKICDGIAKIPKIIEI